ncbi:hypothetical protein KS419_08475, partial [Bacillus tamaricis]|nr:hypothetical protein [Evansella tamaricis]
ILNCPNQAQVRTNGEESRHQLSEPSSSSDKWRVKSSSIVRTKLQFGQMEGKVVINCPKQAPVRTKGG